MFSKIDLRPTDAYRYLRVAKVEVVSGVSRPVANSFLRGGLTAEL